jgi:hypothetical protein
MSRSFRQKSSDVALFKNDVEDDSNNIKELDHAMRISAIAIAECH